MRFSFYLLFALPLLSFSQSNLDQARSSFSNARYIEAKTFCAYALQQNPKSDEALELLGDAHSYLREWRKAESVYKKLCEAYPTRADYHYKLGGAKAMLASDSNKLAALTMVGGIENELLTAIRLDPKHVDARWALIELYLRLPAVFGGGEAKAQRYANALQHFSSVDGYLAKGRIAEYYEKYKMAESFYQQAIASGHSKTTYQKLADLYRNKMNEPEKAKMVLQDYHKYKG